jgi:hypothetical protein
MKAKPFLLLPAVLALVLALQGCVSNQVDASRLKGRRIALVTVVTTSKIRTDDEGEGGIIGLVKQATKKYQASIDSRKIMRYTMPVVFHWLEHNRYFHLVPQREVLRNWTYRHMAQDKVSRSIFTHGLYRVRKGYRYFESKEKFAKLARALHVDGVAYLWVVHSARMSGVEVAGFGKRHAQTMIALSIVGRDGKTILEYHGQENSKGGFIEYTGATNMKRLIPYFVQATRMELNDLDSTLAAKMS